MSMHHNSLINNVPINYQRHDFKNRRSSSEPANEQKLLAHIQNSHNTTINQNTNNSNTNNNSSLVIDDATSSIENPGDDFIDCLHQKNIKVSKKYKKQSAKNHFTVFFDYSICSIFLLLTSNLVVIGTAFAIYFVLIVFFTKA